ncbi:MAG: HEAT repeat domain-containing protein [Pirellulales bacterium]|nr:HEAT repeat domain-containing protein [Pirellulales bacterium]
MPRCLAVAALVLIWGGLGNISVAAPPLEKAQWIWHADLPANAPTDPVYFRAQFPLAGQVKSAELQITCDNHYEVFVNGHKVGQDGEWQNLEAIDVQKQLVQGQNVLAVIGRNESVGPAALAAQLVIQLADKSTVIVATDRTWQAALDTEDKWQTADYQTKQARVKWSAPRELGLFGKTAPWGGNSSPPANSADRWKTLPGFAVEQVLDRQAGSLVAMTFTGQGDLLLSAEGGPLRLLKQPQTLGMKIPNTEITELAAPAKVITYCDKVKNCQGILWHKERVYCVGDGPEGTAFYRLTDENNDDVADKVETLFKFKGGMGEHGPHQPIVGPDGKIYIMIGNHAWYGAEPAKTSPHYGYYEGDLLQPRYEDANGHAAGIKVPGGTVIRCDTDGKNVELFCGGFRNAYDHAFNEAGELFTYDSDMEWDIGLPWYRPTRVNHLIAGADYGWRSGWSPWPDYYLDSLGAVIDIGRGSPTGVTFYKHTAYPAEFHGNMLIADWSRGYIIGVRMKPHGATYQGEQYNFLEGQPLNVADLEVGPDGNVYFCTGGRGTAGGVFRVVCRDQPATFSFGTADELDSNKSVFANNPQSDAAYREWEFANLKKSLGDKWKGELHKYIANTAEAGAQRALAMDLLLQDATDEDWNLIRTLATDKSPEVRAKAVAQLGTQKQTDNRRVVLWAALDDSDPRVRRIACESLVRGGYQVDINKLLKLLADPDTFVAWAARRALEAQPAEKWQIEVIASDNFAVFCRGAVGMLILSEDPAKAHGVLVGCVAWLQKPLSAQQQTDVVRLMQLALIKGKITPDQAAPLLEVVSPLFPAKDWRTQRELARLLVYLQDPTLAAKLVPLLSPVATDEAAAIEQRHLAATARMLTTGWTPELRAGLLAYYDTQRVLDGQGNSFRGYFNNFATDFLKALSPAEQLAMIAAGGSSPGTAAALIRALPQPLGTEQVDALLKLLENLPAQPAPQSAELFKAAVVALGKSSSSAANARLRALFEEHPDLRNDIAAGLAQQGGDNPIHENYPLLVRALATAEGETARHVLTALAKFPAQDVTPGLRRQVILLGLKLKNNGGREAIKLLEHWSGQTLGQGGKNVEQTLAEWQAWFAATYPDQPEAVLPVDTAGNKWTLAQIQARLQAGRTDERDLAIGGAIFEKATCVKCHRFGGKGEGIGPDLSNVGKRFTKKEVVESVLYPSQVISDQFAAKNVELKDGRVLVGLVAPAADGGLVVLQSNAEKVTVAAGEIESQSPSKLSAMPEGLFANLTLDEIVALLHYLSVPPVEGK